jgi:hypothetical protein
MSSLLERVCEALPPEYLVERALGEGGTGVVPGVDELWADAELPYAGLRETARALARRRS